MTLSHELLYYIYIYNIYIYIYIYIYIHTFLYDDNFYLVVYFL